MLLSCDTLKQSGGHASTDINRNVQVLAVAIQPLLSSGDAAIATTLGLIVLLEVQTL
jgi:hypothetical protein